MMKLAYPELHEVIQIKDGVISSVIIENSTFMYHFLQDLYQQMDKIGGKAVLSIDDIPVDIWKKMILLMDFVGMDINRKTLLTKIMGELEKDAMQPQHLARTMSLLGDLETLVDDLCMDFDVDLVSDKMTMGAILKAAGLHIADDYDTLEERLITYMRLIREFEGDKLFVFVNVRSYIETERFRTFADTLIAHDYHVLLIENKDYPRLEMENRLIIDEDLCEI